MSVAMAVYCVSGDGGILCQWRWRYIVSVVMAVYCVSGDGGILCQWRWWYIVSVAMAVYCVSSDSGIFWRLMVLMVTPQQTALSVRLVPKTLPSTLSCTTF